ncbi:MAG: peptidylprolyl isomerase [Isosphaeraceae bacterium]|nr:peptidylprolyl isomerase [Isosphaeraceae bacterium]
MRDRAWGKASRVSGTRKPSAKGLQPVMDDLEERVVLSAALATIPNVSVPATLGYQVPLNGSGGGATSQTYTVTSTDPNIKATVATGQFVTLNVTHTSSGTGDISFSGPITFQLFGDLTPHTTSEIETFVTDGFYNNLQFFRVASGFNSPNSTTTGYAIQGGSASNGTSNTASGQPGTPFPDEFNSQLAFTGTYQVAMANSGPDTNDTQFFFTTASPQNLDFGYTIFAQVVSGQNIVQDMSKVLVKANSNLGGEVSLPVSPITITSATLSATNPNGVLHIDTTSAVPGETSTITVTATDPSTNTTAKQTFTVTTVADPAAPEKPFVTTVPPIVNDIVAGLNQTITNTQTDTFRIPAVAPTPGDQLTYEVGGSYTPPTTSGSPGTLNAIPSADGTATVDANGIVTFKPASGFTGNVNVLVGVRDQTQHAGVSVTDPANYDWHNLTVTVTSGTTPLALAPIALPISQQALVNAPTSFTLKSQNPNTGSTQTLTYTITQNPGHGTITGFDPTTGKLTYTPSPNFTGFDRLQYTVTASGGGQTTSVSLPATVTIDVVNANTGAVRVIDNVLVVTPAPVTQKHAKNTIVVTENNASDTTTATLQVSINGIVDSTQPLVSNINRIVVFGGKASDNVTIDPSVTVPAVTLDGGHGGTNVLNAGSTATREHGWFGHTTLVGGTGANELVGRAGLVKFKPTTTTDEIFAGVPKAEKNGRIQAPGGTFYKFVNGHIVAIPTPKPGPFAHVGKITTSKK